jgi:hypothetical protein
MRAQEVNATFLLLSGTCWGTYLVIRLSSYPEVTAGVNMHPSHSPIMAALGEDEKAAVEAAKNSFQLFMPAGSDHANVKPGGLDSQVSVHGE